MQRHFNPGDFLFRQGDPSDCVMRIERGEVEILRETGDVSIVLGTVEAGQFVGEMGVIERRARNATARASTEVVAEQFSVAEFFQRVSADQGTAQELMLRLSVRLREIEDKIANDLPRAMAKDGAALQQQTTPGPARVLLAADTPTLRGRMGERPITIDEFPFVVGRKLRHGEKVPKRVPDLVLEDHDPHRLSRQHFMIAELHGGLVVRDLESALGTTVNGEAIGTHFQTDVAELRPGVNRIVAGGSGSDFAFSVLVR